MKVLKKFVSNEFVELTNQQKKKIFGGNSSDECKKEGDSCTGGCPNEGYYTLPKKCNAVYLEIDGKKHLSTCTCS